jgi:hypothetical protein
LLKKAPLPVIPKTQISANFNRTTIMYPSPPGVEGAQARPARFTARGTPPEASDEKERKLHPF